MQTLLFYALHKSEKVDHLMQAAGKIEHEKFVFSGNKRADYQSILNLFEKLYEFGWEPVKEGTNIIALSKGNKNITLEPGNQIELSGEK